MPLSDAEIEIAGRLHSFRNYLKIKQKEIAEGSKTKQSQYSFMEAAKKSIQPRVILYLAEKHGLNVDWLFTGRGEMQIVGVQNMVLEPAADYRRKGSEAAMEERIRALENQVRQLMKGGGDESGVRK